MITVSFINQKGYFFRLKLDPYMSVYDLKNYLIRNKFVSSSNHQLIFNNQPLIDNYRVKDIYNNPNLPIYINENCGYYTHDTNYTQIYNVQRSQPVSQTQNYDNQFVESDDDGNDLFLEEEESESSEDSETDLDDVEFYDPTPVTPKKPRKKRTKPVDPPEFDSMVSQLVELGFEVPAARISLRRCNYNIEKAATRLFNNISTREEVDNDEEVEEEEEANENESDTDILKKRQTFTKKKDDLGEFKQLYSTFSPSEQTIINDLSKRSKQPRSTVIQFYMACDKNQESTLICLTNQ